MMSGNHSDTLTMRKLPPLERIEGHARRRQQIAFCVLTLFVLSTLLLLHTLFAPLLGEPSAAVILLLIVSFLLKVVEALWLQSKRDGIPETAAQIETVISSVGLFVLAGTLAYLTNRDDSPYFVLLAIPILQCAFHCRLVPTLTAIAASIGMMYVWTERYFASHPPARPTEYLEAGMIAVIFSLTGLLVWYLVNELKRKQINLYKKITELARAREKLVDEEKLAAVGRLASGIAHEIRNPVAMIASSLATAAYPAADANEREEMFAIAAREATRLENLTSEFLTYARPSTPQRATASIGDIVRHIADVTKMRGAARSIDVTYRMNGEIFAEVDAAQIEAALLNLTLNALDATQSGGHVELRSWADDSMLFMDVENSGKMIPDAHADRVFEPFFTTKPGGTGLGLAIAKGVAVAHGGDIWLSANRDGAVVFTMTLSKHATDEAGKEATNGEGTYRR